MKKPNIGPTFREALSSFRPGDAREAAELSAILDLFSREGERLLLREAAYAHFTASAIILNGKRDRTLMAYHRIYNSWAWTGGHADGGRSGGHRAQGGGRGNRDPGSRTAGTGRRVGGDPSSLRARAARGGGPQPPASESLLSFSGGRFPGAPRPGGGKPGGRLAALPGALRICVGTLYDPDL